MLISYMFSRVFSSPLECDILHIYRCQPKICQYVICATCSLCIMLLARMTRSVQQNHFYIHTWLWIDSCSFTQNPIILGILSHIISKRIVMLSQRGRYLHPHAAYDLFGNLVQCQSKYKILLKYIQMTEGTISLPTRNLNVISVLFHAIHYHVTDLPPQVASVPPSTLSCIMNLCLRWKSEE